MLKKCQDHERLKTYLKGWHSSPKMGNGRVGEIAIKGYF